MLTEVSQRGACVLVLLFNDKVMGEVRALSKMSSLLLHFIIHPIYNNMGQVLHFLLKYM